MRVMRTTLLALGVAWTVLGNAAPASAGVGSDIGDVAPGDTKERVVEVLGAPDGVFQRANQETYIYSRGLVDIVDGKVVRADLLTPKELAQRERERKVTEDERHRRMAAAARDSTERGLAEKITKLRDQAFLSSPGSVRYAYWRSFAQRYPGVDVTKELQEAAQEMSSGKQAAAEAKQQADLGGRVREIDARLKQLDAEYAASLAHWKRNEINMERAKLARELANISLRLIALQGKADGGSP